MNLALLLCCGWALCSRSVAQREKKAPKKIAIIGGGISGTFATKYLVDYDTKCQIDSITVFDSSRPWEGTQDIASDEIPSENWQGSRVKSVRLSDKRIVELGASIGYKDFYLVMDMIRHDSKLKIGAPFVTNNEGQPEPHNRNGLGIYNGNGEWLLNTVNKSRIMNKLYFIWRYLHEGYEVARIAKLSLYKFSKVPELLNSTNADTFFTSPDDIWNKTGLYDMVHTSFDNMLETLGVYSELSAWRKLFPMQGSLRKEFLTAINLVNYNQDTSQINALVGLGSFAATFEGIYSVLGGNAQLMESAVNQAKITSEKHCIGYSQIHLEAKRVTTVIGSHDAFDLYSDQEELGTYDIVILAAPLQQARISFLVKSSVDEAVLQDMPFGSLVNPEEQKTNDGHSRLPTGLHPAATRPYIQVVTTIVRNGTLAAEDFGIAESVLPRSISFTSKGKSLFHNITVVTQVSADAGLYKLFSNNKLDKTVLTKLFGPYHSVEYVKFWGGPHGGATPDYQGDGQAPGFLLWDGSKGVEGYSTSGALYYPSAMEQSTLASMELCAVGAKAVAKLVARRIGLLEARKVMEGKNDEL